MKSKPAVQQTTQLWSSLAPATGAPGRAVLGPARERDLSIGSRGVYADKIEARGSDCFRHDVASPIIPVENGDVAERASGFGGESRWNDLSDCVRRLSFKTIGTLDEFDDRLSGRVVGLVSTGLAERHFGRADDPRC